MVTYDTTIYVTPNATGPNASGNFSLLSAARHEFGHAGGLMDVLNGFDLMFWHQNATDSAQIINHDDQNGGLYILTKVDSNELLHAGIPINIQYFSPVGCPTLTIVNGIDDATDYFMSLSVYPNPFDESITIRAELPEPGNMKVTIFDILGQTVGRNDLGIKSGLVEESISVSSLSAGMYLIQVSVNNQTKQIKLVKR